MFVVSRHPVYGEEITVHNGVRPYVTMSAPFGQEQPHGVIKANISKSLNAAHITLDQAIGLVESKLAVRIVGQDDQTGKDVAVGVGHEGRPYVYIVGAYDNIANLPEVRP